jgi:hypothetical protein
LAWAKIVRHYLKNKLKKQKDWRYNEREREKRERERPSVIDPPSLLRCP